MLWLILFVSSSTIEGAHRTHSLVAIPIKHCQKELNLAVVEAKESDMLSISNGLKLLVLVLT